MREPHRSPAGGPVELETGRVSTQTLLVEVADPDHPAAVWQFPRVLGHTLEHGVDV